MLFLPVFDTDSKRRCHFMFYEMEFCQKTMGFLPKIEKCYKIIELS